MKIVLVHFEYRKVEHNQTIYFLFLVIDFFFKKNQIIFFLSNNIVFDFESLFTLEVSNVSEKMFLTSKTFLHDLKSFIGHLKL